MVLRTARPRGRRLGCFHSSSRRRREGRGESSSSLVPHLSRRRYAGARERKFRCGAPRPPPRPHSPGARDRPAYSPGRPGRLPRGRPLVSRRGGRVNRLPQDAQVPVTRPSGLVENCSGPPQFRHGRALGADELWRSVPRYPLRRGGCRSARSSSVRSTNSNDELHPVQAADSPEGTAVISSGAPQREQGGPAEDILSVEG
jgi:hypothetical protein